MLEKVLNQKPSTKKKSTQELLQIFEKRVKDLQEPNAPILLTKKLERTFSDSKAKEAEAELNFLIGEDDGSKSKRGKSLSGEDEVEEEEKKS